VLRNYPWLAGLQRCGLLSRRLSRSSHSISRPVRPDSLQAARAVYFVHPEKTRDQRVSGDPQ
jgi:hypothetical protein